MTKYVGYSDVLSHPDLLVKKFKKDLSSINPELGNYMAIESKIQIKNLVDLIRDSNQRIGQYEHIYPLIKEMCTGQRINPMWYQNIEKILEWALKKGRGDRHHLSLEIRDAWLTYIAVLSYSMIDTHKDQEVIGPSTRTEKNRINFTGNTQ